MPDLHINGQLPYQCRTVYHSDHQYLDCKQSKRVPYNLTMAPNQHLPHPRPGYALPTFSCSSPAPTSGPWPHNSFGSSPRNSPGNTRRTPSPIHSPDQRTVSPAAHRPSSTTPFPAFDNDYFTASIAADGNGDDPSRHHTEEPRTIYNTDDIEVERRRYDRAVSDREESQRRNAANMYGRDLDAERGRFLRAHEHGGCPKPSPRWLLDYGLRPDDDEAYESEDDDGETVVAENASWATADEDVPTEHGESMSATTGDGSVVPEATLIRRLSPPRDLLGEPSGWRYFGRAMLGLVVYILRG